MDLEMAREMEIMGTVNTGNKGKESYKKLPQKFKYVTLTPSHSIITSTEKFIPGIIVSNMCIFMTCFLFILCQ